MELIFSGDFALANATANQWLADCTAELLFIQDVECVSISEGSIVVLFKSSNPTHLDKVLVNMTQNGLYIESMDITYYLYSADEQTITDDEDNIDDIFKVIIVIVVVVILCMIAVGIFFLCRPDESKTENEGGELTMTNVNSKNDDVGEKQIVTTPI